MYADGRLLTTLRGDDLVQQFIAILNDYVAARYGLSVATAQVDADACSRDVRRWRPLSGDAERLRGRWTLHASECHRAEGLVVYITVLGRCVLLSVERIAVLGAGTMGHGIAQVAAMSGFRVVLQDVANEALDRGLGADRVEHGPSGGERPPERSGGAAGQGAASTPPSDLAEAVSQADFVIEAVPEDLELKLSVFAEVDELAPRARGHRQQYFSVQHHPPGRGDEPPRPGVRNALFQSARR